ncbi:hypothetical protein MFM001_41310 [Mycobacterium sp. MFM001]|uniref:hypothetical protein n=1 Tax=Mycobacterium sp. MFM001 TaxID=2049453 RepID=UPI000DA4EC59|nr:hypothetical protein [Mycobacterium sp. MFM001]GBE67669.1 hypothetical protein MFM001_41310 [Mycobacterium sp. MFM001]
MVMANDEDGSARSRDSTAALAALYAAERTDVQNILGHALTLVSVLVAYATVIGAAWATRPDTIPHYLIPVIPIPALLVIAWHSQLNSRVWAHNQAIFILEQRLLDQIPSIKNPTRLWIGHTSGRLVNEIPILLKERRFGMAAASMITYGGILIIVLALTVASLVVPIVVYRDWQWLAWTMAAVYAIALFLLAASYKSTFGVNIETMDEWAKSAHASFPEQFREGS